MVGYFVLDGETRLLLNDPISCAKILFDVIPLTREKRFMADESTIQVLPKLRLKYVEFLDNYFLMDVNFNATEAYHRTYQTVTRETCRREGHKLLTRPDIQAHIEARFAERRMGKSEAVDRLTQQARASIGTFFKIIDEWTFHPLATDEILETREIDTSNTEDNEKKEESEKKQPIIKVMYRVRRLVLDVDKVIDPQYSHLIREFTDKGRDGMSIKLHDPQKAEDMVLRVLGAYKDHVDVSVSQPVTVVEIVKTYETK